jgi:hypothetical protein
LAALVICKLSGILSAAGVVLLLIGKVLVWW